MNEPQKTQTRSKSNLRGLLALNAALLIILAAVTFGSSSVRGAQARGRGEYTMVAGGAPGTDASAIYIADVANQELVVMVYNQQTKTLDGVAYRNLSADAVAATRSRNRPNQ